MSSLAYPYLVPGRLTHVVPTPKAGWVFVGLVLIVLLPQRSAAENLKLRITWGHSSKQTTSYNLRPELSPGLQLHTSRGFHLETGDTIAEKLWQTQAGAGDVDGVDLELTDVTHDADLIPDLHIIWADLISAFDADTVARWSRDASLRPQSPKLTILTNAEGTTGFSITLDQMRREPGMWIPSLDMYIATGAQPMSFEQQQEELRKWQGRRILDQTKRGPEATYEQFKQSWEDMGNPSYRNPEQRGPGHIVGLGWDSSIAKFGIDRGGGVWSDYGNPDRFQFWFDFGDLEHGAGQYWTGQRLQDGLPVITTEFLRDGIRYSVEQFAFPIDGPPAERRGDIDMALFQKIRLTNTGSTARSIPVTL